MREIWRRVQRHYFHLAYLVLLARYNERRWDARLHARVCVYRKDALAEPQYKLARPSERGPSPTRFTTLSCNYHHKVDFTSSKSPRKGMLHFAHTLLRPRALNRRLSTTPRGYNITYGKPPYSSLGPSSLPAASLFLPFRNVPFDYTENVKTCRRLPFTFCLAILRM